MGSTRARPAHRASSPTSSAGRGRTGPCRWKAGRWRRGSGSMTISNIKFSKRKTIADTRYSDPSTMSIGTRVGSSPSLRKRVNEDPVAHSVYLITHEQAHQSAYAAEGKLKRFAGHGIDNPAAERAVMESVRPCTNCGGRAAHMHGRHPCCGSAFCHMTIGASHIVPGEEGLRRGSLAPRFEW